MRSTQRGSKHQDLQLILPGLAEHPMVHDLTILTLQDGNTAHTYIAAKVDGCKIKFAFMPPDLIEVVIETTPESNFNFENDQRVVDAVKNYIRAHDKDLGFGIPPDFQGVGFITRLISTTNKE